MTGDWCKFVYCFPAQTAELLAVTFLSYPVFTHHQTAKESDISPVFGSQTCYMQQNNYTH